MILSLKKTNFKEFEYKLLIPSALIPEKLLTVIEKTPKVYVDKVLDEDDDYNEVTRIYSTNPTIIFTFIYTFLDTYYQEIMEEEEVDWLYDAKGNTLKRPPGEAPNFERNVMKMSHRFQIPTESDEMLEEEKEKQKQKQKQKQKK